MKKYKNKFLEVIGCEDGTSKWYFTKARDKRLKRWKKERKQWGGWDSRVGWNLSIFVLENLYTWLRIYYKEASKFINLEYHTFKINGETLTQKQCVLRMIKDLKFILQNYESSDKETINRVMNKTRDCFNILGECLFALWF